MSSPFRAARHALGILDSTDEFECTSRLRRVAFGSL
jgi:hypothetical protein